MYVRMVSLARALQAVLRWGVGRGLLMSRKTAKHCGAFTQQLRSAARVFCAPFLPGNMMGFTQAKCLRQSTKGCTHAKHASRV